MCIMAVFVCCGGMRWVIYCVVGRCTVCYGGVLYSRAVCRVSGRCK